MSDPIRAAYQVTDDYQVRVRTHALYSVADQSWTDWLLAQLPRHGVRTVLDLGCGAGAILRLIAAAGIGQHWVGVDQSEAMVAEARRLADAAGLSITYRLGDILDAPGEERFDLVCACHMLYHVSDIDTALAQCVRRLAPGGTFVATTNSRDTMAPYDAQVWAALKQRFPGMRADAMTHVRFSLENSVEFLLPHFDHIELRVRRDAFRFPSPEPWADHLKSCRHLTMPDGHTDADWAQAADLIDRLARAQFTDAELIVPKVAGAFLCQVAVPGG